MFDSTLWLSLFEEYVLDVECSRSNHDTALCEYLNRIKQ